MMGSRMLKISPVAAPFPCQRIISRLLSSLIETSMRVYASSHGLKTIGEERDLEKVSVFDSRIVDHCPKNVNRISLPENKKLLIEIGSHLTYFVQVLIENFATCS